MNFTPQKTIRIIGVPMDLGASRRGTDMGPSALRITGLGAEIRSMGYTVEREEDIPVPAMETRSVEDSEARFKPQILSVCTQLAERVRDIMNEGEFPLVIGGDHSIAMGTVSGAAAHETPASSTPHATHCFQCCIRPPSVGANGRGAYFPGNSNRYSSHSGSRCAP